MGQGRGCGLRGTPRRLPARRWGSALRAEVLSLVLAKS